MNEKTNCSTTIVVLSDIQFSVSADLFSHCCHFPINLLQKLTLVEALSYNGSRYKSVNKAFTFKNDFF